MSAFRILLINKALEQKEYNRALSQKVENIMACNEQLDMFINTAKEMADKLKHAYKIGKDTGFKEGYKLGVEDTESHAKQEKKPEWIPALVKYQNPPDYWHSGKATENKKKMMGTVILVKKSIQIPENCPGYSSIRNDDTGKGFYHWRNNDLILYPCKDDIDLANAQAWCFK